MADEAAVAAEVEAAPEAREEEQQKPRTVEDLALDLGWKPKDQWQGDETLWQPAEDFLRAPRESRDHSKRELRGLRDQIDRLTRTSSQILADTIAKKDSELAALQARAVEDGDSSAVDRIVSERIKLKDQAPAASEPGLPPETQDFIARHRFLETDSLAQYRAAEVAQGLAKLGKPIGEQLQAVERMLKKEFPEHFPRPAKESPGTHAPGSRAATGGSKPKGFADMPEESRKMALDYEKRHGIKKEDFAASYWADEAKKQRRA